MKVMEHTSQSWIQMKAEYPFLAIGVALTVVYAYGQLNLDFIRLFTNVITPFEALAACGMAAMVLKAHSVGGGGGMSRVYASYSLGLGLWFLAELAWASYTLAFGIDVPYPSMADLFWLLGYVPLLVALLLQAWPYRENFFSLRQIALTAIMFIVAFLILEVSIPPVFEENPDLLTLGVGVAYPILDTMLLAIAVPIFLFFRKGAYWRPMLFVMLGIMIQLVADLAFNQAFLTGSYYQGSFTDLIYDWSYLLLALGFYKQLKPDL